MDTIELAKKVKKRLIDLELDDQQKLRGVLEKHGVALSASAVSRALKGERRRALVRIHEVVATLKPGA